MKNDLEKKIEFVKECVLKANFSDKTEYEILKTLASWYNEITEKEVIGIGDNKKFYAFDGHIWTRQEIICLVSEKGYFNLERLLIALNKIGKFGFSQMQILIYNQNDGENGIYSYFCKYDLTNEQTISKLAEIFGYSEN